MNKYDRHIYVIPEDDANRQIADGFIGHHEVNDVRIKMMPPAGGWAKVLKTFQDEYIPTLKKYPLAHIVMLIDFDGQVDRRRERFEQEIPDDVQARVFVVGSRENPEELKKSLNRSFEKIGTALAGDCASGSTQYWHHDHLKHNDAEWQRLNQVIKPILF